MALTLAKPIVENGVTYPLVAVQMIINPRIENGGFINSVVVNFTAYRLMPNGTVEALVDDPSAGAPRIPPLLISDATALSQRDLHVGQAFGGILGAIQQFLTAKGI